MGTESPINEAKLQPTPDRGIHFCGKHGSLTQQLERPMNNDTDHPFHKITVRLNRDRLPTQNVLLRWVLSLTTRLGVLRPKARHR